MDKTGVTKRGRPRKYKTNAERQQAYRKRRKADKEEQYRKWFHRKRKLDPNRMIDNIVLALSVFSEDRNSINSRKQLVDPERLPEWIASLCESRKELNRFIRFLKNL